jgi:uncharacterized membrane protein YgcG
LISIQ